MQHCLFDPHALRDLSGKARVQCSEALAGENMCALLGQAFTDLRGDRLEGRHMRRGARGHTRHVHTIGELDDLARCAFGQLAQRIKECRVRTSWRPRAVDRHRTCTAHRKPAGGGDLLQRPLGLHVLFQI
ncbi:MAG: hypothetical protein COV75_00955 [Candidatus Omnitrophica bacterium CG11_big_fil_rev_8_21_14_0_20_63_9]|nr:MAG: hypothetical protein COV75_00955 [Candidatus Omnitrophica bacterium CG11_big_fil_rev_8_21_14_0_20_63_9]